MAIQLPEKCRRGLTTCRPLSEIASDCGTSFFCCGENDGSECDIEQDKYTVCFKGEHCDRKDFYDKRDLIHNAAVILQAVAAVEKYATDERDWSPWDEQQEPDNDN